MDWLRKLLHPDSMPARTMRLDTAFARQVAILHHQGGFARGWEPAECAALIADAGVVADGIFGRGSDPVGFVMSRKAADEAEILSIAVAPANRRDGLGRVLLAAHLARLAEDGVAHVFLEVEEGNVAAERLYRHFGFREVGRRKGYYPKVDGSRATAIAMRLDLA
ncbi:Ribosomal-protein-S18p-alanine acetyltransferase [Hyphomicrobiales bacterium]|nr:Ribosomal-protein-S18p-alanine acetyltransferase [Hyphomicrobiales bacterium]CAH1698195.1 Ribosomal-protein-S18p-alanine acetyltransferase [Hyphomicrobiales bacterium]CAI0347838.1 (ribosomal protein S18)-alanine N-acetyltransferase [Hyphomicrobiales bacterium]